MKKTLKTFYNTKSLRKHVLQTYQNYDLISFDFFDTLVIRRVADPDTVKAPVARFAGDLAERAGIKCPPSVFQEARDRAEQTQRARNASKYPDAEASYREFMTEALSRFFKEPDAAQAAFDAVAGFEMDIEKSVIVPRQEMVDTIKTLHNAGKKIIILTDIYLTSDYIRELADHAGISKYVSDIVSSADSFHAKASGAAFRILLEKYNIAPEKWMHIGDNPVSDGARPASSGIQSLVLRDTREKHRKAVYRRYAGLAETSRFWRGRLLEQLMLPLEQENTETDHRYRLGYSFFGFLISAFALRIIERTRELGVKRVFFFSREGFIFLNIWKNIAPCFFKNSDMPDARYLHVSRTALAGPACARNGLTHTNAHLALLPAGNRNMRDLCRVFGLDIEPLKPFLKKHDLDENTPLNSILPEWKPEYRNRLDSLLSDSEARKVIRGQTAEQGRLLEKYLEQEGFFGEDKVIVVDMGWLGTIQRFLSEATGHRPDKPDIHGLVFAASRGIPFPTGPGNTLEGCIFDRDNMFDSAAGCVNCALDLFEEACRAPHAGVIGYKENNDLAEPVLRKDNDPEREREKEQDKYYAKLQQGMLDASVRFAAALKITGYTFADISPWINHLMAMHLAFPKTQEIKTLKYLHHLDDFGGKHAAPLKTRLRQTRLWSMSPSVIQYIPFTRMFFFLLHLWRNRR